MTKQKGASKSRIAGGKLGEVALLATDAMRIAGGGGRSLAGKVCTVQERMLAGEQIYGIRLFHNK